MGQISRVEVARHLQVSPATVTSSVSELLRAGLLREVEDTSSTRAPGRGRPRVALAVKPDAAYVAGIKLSDHEHSGAIIDLSGQVLVTLVVPRLSQSAEPGDVLRAAGALLDQLTDLCGLPRDAISALGLGMPGAIEHTSGRMLWSPLIAGQNLNIRDLATEILGLPVEIDNDANLVTLAELWYGAGRDIDDFAVVTVEHGVGMGLVVGNRLYRGAHGIGLELGHTKVQLDGALCRCGRRGCLEAYVADYALLREAGAAMAAHKFASGPAGLLELHQAAIAGDTAARQIFHRAGRFLAVGLANVANLFDPSLIILAGERMRYDFLFADELLQEMRSLTLSADRAPQRVEKHTWGGDVWARGAATLALSTVTDGLTAAAGQVAP